MLMTNTDRLARLHYGPNGFRVLSGGDHVLCAATGARIAVDDLRYWSVALQAPFASARLAMEAMAPK